LADSCRSHFHVRYPERVAALVLSGNGPGYRKDAPREAWNATANSLADEIERGGLEWLRDRSAEVDPTEHKSAAGLINAGRRMLTQTDGAVIDSLPSISVPTFIAVGSNDDNYLAATEYLETKIKGSQRHVFEGAGHAPNHQAPEDFNAALAGFLQSNAAAFASLSEPSVVAGSILGRGPVDPPQPATPNVPDLERVGGRI
jgi:3-oxoadipate enol-lactonase